MRPMASSTPPLQMFPGPSVAANPVIHEHLPAYAGLKAFFARLEEDLGLKEQKEDEAWIPRVGVYLFGGLAAHLYTGEHPTTTIHATLSYPISVPTEFHVMVPLPGGLSTMKMASSPKANELRWPEMGDGFEINLPLGVESFGVRVVQPLDLVVSMCTYFTPEEEAHVASLVRAGLITGSNFDYAWKKSFKEDPPSARDREIHAQVLTMLAQHTPGSSLD